MEDLIAFSSRLLDMEFDFHQDAYIMITIICSTDT